MKSYSEALQIIKDEVTALNLQTEIISIEKSVNRILADDIYADVDLPPFDNSAMDGYAIKYSQQTVWKVLGEVSAGNFNNLSPSKDEAVLITTGSKIPNSTDTIIPVEDVSFENDLIKLKDNTLFQKGMNIRTKGNDLKKDKTALSKFTKLDSKTIAVAASCGKSELFVFKQFKIALLASGDELIPITEKPSEDKLRVSNIYSLQTAVKEINHIPISYGFVKDHQKLIKNKIQQMLSDDNDIIITTGGVSVGKYDFIRDVFEELGIRIKFWKANIKPGKPIVFGVHENDNSKKIVFGLPGNPVSALVNFYIFVRPAIDQLFHQNEADHFFAELDNDLKKNDNKRHFSRGISFFDGMKLKIRSTFSQSSGNLVEMSKANCLIEIPEEVLNPKKGIVLKCIKI